MSSRTWHGLLVPATLVAVTVAIANNGCSSSSNNNMMSGDASTNGDASTIGRHPDAGSVEDATSQAPDAGGPAFDGTTGKTCASDADCNTGAGTNACSSDYLFTVNGVQVQLWPTPICLVQIQQGGTGNCDPGPAGTIQFCDSADPNDTTSPGICVPLTSPQQAGFGNGICLPSCTFATDGSPQQGCAGSDTCINLTFLLDPTTDNTLGFGFCQGSCTTDADCSALGSTWGCQTDIGFCTQKKKTRTKAIGAACTNSGTNSDSNSGACNCFSGSGVTAGYCTSSCVVGGPPCPNGYVCDALEQPTLTFVGAAPDGSDVTVPGPPTQNPGLAGTCFQPCTLADAASPVAPAGDGGDDGGAAGEGGAAAAGTCDTLSTCTPGTLVGPDCQPM